jgi:hypothetical protein
MAGYNSAGLQGLSKAPPPAIVLGYDYFQLQQGIRMKLTLPLKSASYLVFGSSNSGKSVLVKTICARISQNISDSQITICDGKADDYTFLRGIENARHYEYLAMADGLTAFHKDFEERLQGNPDRSYRLIVLEEWSSFLRIQEQLDKKAPKGSPKIAQEAISQLFSITSQGRAYNVHALVSLQRPDSDFLSGFRENLTVICGLGRISSQASVMAGFNEFKEFDGKGEGQGVGWLLTEQGGLNKIVVPRVTDFNKLHKAIIWGATR